MRFKAIFLILCSFAFSEEMAPLDLAVPHRFDIMAKYIYAKHREWKTASSFGKELYSRHLQVWNRFHEDDPPKNSFDDYLNAFNHLLDSIKIKGFDPSYAVPLDPGGVIANGAHRLTASLLYHKNVPVQSCSDVRDYGFAFFQNRGLEPKYLDAMALQYCELKPNSHVLVIFPAAKGLEKEIETIIRCHAEIVYKKEVELTEVGTVNLILTMYDGEHWIGNAGNNYQGIRKKAQGCFPESHPIRIYLVESENLKACKQEIRALFNHLQHVVHATDTHSEAIVLARTLFNQNSIHCLNHRKDLFFPQFERYFENYRKALAGKENDWFALDGSAVLAAYGIRDCRDFDVLHYDNIIPDCESHNDYLPLHAFSLDDILFDPENHFFYRGVKFCALPVIKQMKMRRGEPKDFRDIDLISEIPHSHCAKMPLE